MAGPLMLSGYCEGGSPAYGSSFVIACDKVLLGKPKVLEGYAPREEKKGNEKNQTLKTVTGRESNGNIGNDLLLNVIERRQVC